jgi:hypothetical protein
MVGIEAVDQPYGAFQQHSLDTSAIEDHDGRRDFLAKLGVALCIRGVYSLEECPQFLAQRSDQVEIPQRCRQCRQDELRAGVPDHALPVDSLGAHYSAKLVSRRASLQPLRQDADNHIKRMPR